MYPGLVICLAYQRLYLLLLPEKKIEVMLSYDMGYRAPWINSVRVVCISWLKENGTGRPQKESVSNLKCCCPQDSLIMLFGQKRKHYRRFK